MPRTSFRPLLAALAAGAAALLVACADGAPTSARPTPTPLASYVPPFSCGTSSAPGCVPGSSLPGDGAPHTEQLQVCKYYANGDAGAPVQIHLAVSNDAGLAEAHDFVIQPNECRIIWQEGEIFPDGSARPVDHVTVTEVGPSGYSTTSQVTIISRPGPYESGITPISTVLPKTSDLTVSGDVGGAHIPGVLVVFTNTKLPPPDPAVGKIGDYTWIDANGNGRQDAGEPALAGVMLTLGGASSGTQASSGSGAYGFSSLAAGSYTVSPTVPAGWMLTTTSAAGTTGANDSNGGLGSSTLPTNSSSDLTLDFGFVPVPRGGQGCTPGYWKQSQHMDSWRWYASTDKVDAVFGVTYRSTAKNNPTGPLSLLDALELNGNGAAEQLFRHGTAALLNSVYQSGVAYQYSAPQVIKMVHDAYVSGNAATWNATQNLLANANEARCPLN